MQRIWTNVGFAVGLISLIIGAFHLGQAAGYIVVGIVMIALSVVHYKDAERPKVGDGT